MLIYSKCYLYSYEGWILIMIQFQLFLTKQNKLTHRTNYNLPINHERQLLLGYFSFKLTGNYIIMQVAILSLNRKI